VSGRSISATQGRDFRPWELWLVPGMVAIAAPLCGIMSVVLHYWRHWPANYLIFVFWCAVVFVPCRIFDLITKEATKMWRKLSVCVGDHQKGWRAQRPKITKTLLGMIVRVRPVPRLDTIDLGKALAKLANELGMSLSSFKIDRRPGRFWWSQDRPTLVFELEY
jgi:hypothetical protein